MTTTADIQPEPGLGIDTCTPALQRAMDTVVDLRGRLAGAEGTAAAWRMLLGDALAEAAGEVYVPNQIVTHPSTGPRPFVVWHFSATLPNGLPPQLILVCWPVRATDWADKVRGDEHHFPASECTVIGMRETETDD